MAEGTSGRRDVVPVEEAAVPSMTVGHRDMGPETVVGEAATGGAPQADVRTPIERMFIRHHGPDRFADEGVLPSSARLRWPIERRTIRREELAMCHMIRAEGGGPLRSFSGGLAHETGWHHSRKADRMLGWEGETAYELLIAAESDHAVRRIETESVAFESVLDGIPFHYTIDLELVMADGTNTFVEVKRTEADLRDERLRDVLAFVREACRRCGIRFLIVFRSGIWADRHHRRNAHLVARHAFTPIDQEHRLAIRRHFDEAGRVTTRGALAAALAPDRPAHGRALVDACTIGRLVRMDITKRRLGDATEVRPP